MEKIDQLIREALQTEEKAPEELNRKLAQDMAERAELTLGKNDSRSGRWMRPAVALLCAAVILCTAPAAYAMVRGNDITGLFAKLWDFSEKEEQAADGRNGAATPRKKIADIRRNQSLAALESICSEVSVVKERSTYQNIQIEPVMAVGDRYSMYLVLRITGDKKIISENHTGFSYCIFGSEKKGEDIAETYQDYLLAAEGNVMYYAVRVQYHAQGQKQAGKYFLKAGNLCYADDVDSMGRIGKFKTDKDGSPLIAQEGQYELTFSVPVSDQKVTARIDGMKVTITTLNACFLGGKDAFQDKVDQKTGTRIPEAYLFMKDGSKVEVISEATTTEGNLLCGLERPVDTEQIRSLEFQGKEYPVK